MCLEGSAVPCLYSVTCVAGQGTAVFQPFQLSSYTLVSAVVGDLSRSHLQSTFLLPLWAMAYGHSSRLPP